MIFYINAVVRTGVWKFLPYFLASAVYEIQQMLKLLLSLVTLTQILYILLDEVGLDSGGDGQFQFLSGVQVRCRGVSFLRQDLLLLLLLILWLVFMSGAEHRLGVERTGFELQRRL
jgi:hypothetical protein